MRLDAYLDRIGLADAPRADLDGFRSVHRAHALSLTYENLDVQLRVPLTRDPADAYDKIVNRRRGGWCYEMNGLLGWALEEMGFKVTRLAGAVMREILGDDMIGNHLVLLVDIDGMPWIGDVGFGDGLIDPIPLRVGKSAGNSLNCVLSDIGDGWWRYSNDPRTGGPNFDFNSSVTDEALLERLCGILQTDPASPFVQNAVVQRWVGDTHYSLRGRVLRILSPTEERKSLLHSADEYVETIKTTFEIDAPQAGVLWPDILRRHDEIFAEKDAVAV